MVTARDNKIAAATVKGRRVVWYYYIYTCTLIHAQTHTSGQIQNTCTCANRYRQPSVPKHLQLHLICTTEQTICSGLLNLYRLYSLWSSFCIISSDMTKKIRQSLRLFSSNTGISDREICDSVDNCVTLYYIRYSAMVTNVEGSRRKNLATVTLMMQICFANI